MKVIGVDIGGTKIAAGPVDESGALLSVVTTPTPPTPDEILGAVIALCHNLIETQCNIQAIGVGAAGQIDINTGIVTYSNPNLPGWQGTAIKTTLEKALNLPVIVDNDVNAMAAGESAAGAGKNYDHILYITIGTGIGGAIVREGRVWRGASHSAGEIGYLVAGWDADSKPISIENIASGPALERHYQHITHKKRQTLQQIAARAQEGDPVAIEVIQQGARQLGHVLGGIICLLDPQVVIVGGGVPQIGPLWWEPFQAAVRESDLPACQNTHLIQAHYQTNAVLIGAAWLALNHL